MRVLVLEDKELNCSEVIEIIDIGYDDDITGIKDKNGQYDHFTSQPVTGLYMISTDGDFLYIAGIPVNECNKICRDIAVNGYVDLTRYGEYYFYEE